MSDCKRTEAPPMFASVADSDRTNSHTDDAPEVPVSTSEAGMLETNVVEYLRCNPDFFVKHEYLLKEIAVPHSSGSAISLVERQVQVFREQRDALRQELTDLVEIARQNDRFFEKTKRLLLDLLDCDKLDDMIVCLDESIRNDFNLDHSSLLIFGDEALETTSTLCMVPYQRIYDILGDALDSTRAVCGRLQAEHYTVLFPHVESEVGSAAVIPLRHQRLLGVFSIGSADRNYFDNGMGSLFLSYISDTLSRVLPGLLASIQPNDERLTLENHVN